MKFISGLLALAALASAAPGKAPTPLDIKLESAGNAEIKAVITNTGKNNLKIFKTGTILDSSPIEKVKISSGGKSSLNYHCLRRSTMPLLICLCSYLLDLFTSLLYFNALLC